MKRTIPPKELLSRKNDIFLLDVRRKTDLAPCHYAIPGADWRDPDEVDAWNADLPRSHDVVIYCARGGPVSNRMLDHLREKKISARYIEGGIAAWNAAGGTTEYRK